ncbi:MAG: MATE family efflux transporter [Bacillota bacterium]
MPAGEKQPLRSGRVNLIDGPILPALLTLAWPVVLSNLLQTGYNLADTYWVGRLGAEAVAAVSLSFPIVFLFISLGGGFTVAGTALVAQNIGAGREDRANYVAAQTFGFVGLAAVCLAILGFILAESVLTILGPEPDVFPDALAYLRTWFTGVPFVFGFFIFQALVRGSGDTINPMKLMVGSTILNIILDPFFIFGWSFFPELGVQGAAVATVLSRGLAAAIGISMLFRSNLGLRIRAADLKPDLATIRRIVIIGTPAAAEQSMRALGMTAMTATAAAFGTAALAAYGIGNRISSVVFQPSMGFAQATTAMVGQNLGAKRDDRAESTAWLSAGIMLSLLTVLGAVAFAWPGGISSVFLTAGDAVALSHAENYLRIIAFSFGFIGVMNVLNGAFRGAGRTATAMTFSLISMFALRVPLAYGLSHHTHLGPAGIWWGVALSNVVGALLVAMWFSRGSWKGRLIGSEKKGVPGQV